MRCLANIPSCKMPRMQPNFKKWPSITNRPS
ncbi:Uncharacterised protein [Vibrio cholerae]|nr:Uncharacterised protein [Vibrio cholerae]